MIFNCRRCGEHGELRKRKVTGNNVAKYRQHEAEINSSLILELKSKSYSKRLCPSCLEELSIWIANRESHVKVPRPVKSAPVKGGLTKVRNGSQ
jgi:DNA-directed RNA polymerase subunit M/transcription elongation factor TFIIS